MGTLGESALDNEYAEAGAINYGDWMGGFYHNGFAVVKGCIPEEKAKHYQSKALDWRQSFNLGFDPKDESIWTKAHLPEGFKEELNTIFTHVLRKESQFTFCCGEFGRIAA
ncbi:hypothetical protein F5882DRAFT_506036 [Hyaloscypha sp. PMI_1271]|nr:hypothetical protein F5882DRAFT_506036 [Hyaloscypha sp. PMI_1271]